MKKLILLIILIAIGGFYYYRVRQTPSTISPGSTTGSTFTPNASSATFSFDDGSTVSLSKGYNSTVEDSGDTQETRLLDEKGSGDLNGDGKIDSAVLLSQSGSGSGVFIYVAAYVSGTVSYKGTNAVFIGDRIAPQSVTVSNGVITVKYLDRKPDEPYAADPTVPATKQFVYRNGELQEK